MATPRLRSLPATYAGLLLLTASSLVAATADPAAVLDRAIAEAEAGLRLGELQMADSHYRSALLEGWLLMGALEVARQDLPAAEKAFERAAAAAVERRRAVISLALVRLHLGAAPAAVSGLRDLLARRQDDLEIRRLLAQALVAAGQPGEALQELEEARAKAPDDPEVAFTLATGHLREGRVERAEELFDEIASDRPSAEKLILIGRTYRDFREFERARSALEAALEMDPGVERAHYYLGTIELLAEGRARLGEAVAEFEQELLIAPDDSLTRLYHGMALTESRRFEEALESLRFAAASAVAEADIFLYLGRCHLALDRPAEAAAALGRALELAEAEAEPEVRQLETIHYQLALALRAQGDRDSAARHFDAAKSYSEEITAGDRERLSRYLGGDLERLESKKAFLPPLDVSALPGLGPSQLLELAERVTTALSRVYSNLGVMQLQAGRFARAAVFFEKTADLDPDFPRVQYSLGVAYFNSRQFEKAAPPLARALEESPSDSDVRRMLALSWLESEAYAKAAELLEGDPEREANPSLQYAYGMALVRSGSADEAERIFALLVARHGDWPELGVLIGQAHAQQGDFPAAVESLERALRLKEDVAEANATLGGIYMRQGKLDEAEAAFEAELAHHPDDVRSQYQLATVLDLNRKSDEAVPVLRTILEAQPEHADARYLLGKILLGRGAAEEAAAQLEAAVRLAPEDPNIHYQLGQAYQRLGRGELARRQFETFRELKGNRRGDGS